ncbi:ABC transporter permease subunit [Streptomyces sp. H27-G5]|uniref:ABC transporter permease subunit n=1 Tax=Streptomyces sp. H27-G5 TaxID=2996698 RepID=UPI00226E679A|nr:ABC transporter permease subunit [Streptomyces sp. H27-G5]MCY0919724.1 ABC transporter permease subunit [Streptomyces sp. H27-G5]
MTAYAPAPPPAPVLATASAVESPARFRDLVASEWIKTRSLRSTWWALALTLVFVIGSAAAAALAEVGNLEDSGPNPTGNRGFLSFVAYPPPGYWPLMVVAAALGALTVVSEYGSGLIRTTTVAVPARGAVVVAKAVVTAALWSVAGAVVSTGSFLVSQAVLDGRHAGVPFTHPGVARALVASALLAPVCALVGLGIGALIRHGVATMVVGVFTLLMLPPVFSQSERWSAAVNHAMPSSAWRRLVQSWEPDSSSLDHAATVAGSWTVYVLWPLIAVVLAVVVVRRRDV